MKNFEKKITMTYWLYTLFHETAQLSYCMYLVKESSKQNIKTLRRLNFKIIVVIKYSFI